MALDEPADSKVASLAALGLFDPASLTPDDVRAICATALARVPDHRQSEIVQARPLYEQIDMALATIRLGDQPNGDAAETARGSLTNTAPKRAPRVWWSP